MTSEGTRDALERARAALDGFVELREDDDGSLSFSHAGVPGAVQAVELSPGLVVLSMTCVLAWDLVAGPDLDAAVARLGAQVQFGGIGLVQRGSGPGATADVTLRYAFPGAGLAPEALATLLLLVVSGASRAGTELGGHGQG